MHYQTEIRCDQDRHLLVAESYCHEIGKKEKGKEYCIEYHLASHRDSIAQNIGRKLPWQKHDVYEK